ncbi:serine/threonine protein phosphatase [Pleurocapsa sp. CCALA 161]|uniref:serine/threonine phosphatase n=1 Tax=Pleurocapsa sp. CCALA 161 TaxID=2107688 RepID=UPI000D05E957|nr:serine/threonine phosphatase [Pleurocapsa sp. CCALA 161]PSB08247.1 serine/threonine protein phosphatase [Pleurocapsa sp. CCALA 161]
MLICPQCEFENPESNRFCQSCGVSLTHKVCCQCEANIPIQAKICNSCGADNHTVLWAIISQTKTLQPNLHNLQPQLAQVGNDINHQSALEISSLADLFAHSQSKTTPALQIQTDNQHTYNRYAIKTEPSSAKLLSNTDHNFPYSFIESQVIDQYPLHKSHLATLQKQQMDLFTELSQDLNDSYLAVTEYWNLIGLPTHALPYLILERYTPTIPRIYDAWQQQDQGVVLLPDRSQWQLVTELWSQQKLALSQIVWFFDEMAKLWQPLQRTRCVASLLIPENLRIDEDQAFCLQQLYMDKDEIPSLQDLAQTWQLCLAEAHLEQIEQLNLLLNKMLTGEIIEVEQLRLELHNLGFDETEVEFLETNEPHLPNTTLSNTTPTEPTMTESESQAIAAQAKNFFAETDDDMMYSSELEEQATAMISMHLKDITDACCTNIGVQRDHNEDFFGVRTTVERIENNTEKNLSARGLYIVCDGMGGHAAGEVASAMAVESLQKYFQTHWRSELPSHDIIESGVLQANQTLYQTNIENLRSGSGRMGTTLVMALLQDTQMAIAHVGDSRIYRLSRKQGLEQLTLDHEVGQREINRGVEPEIAYARPDAYQLTQALGPRENSGIRPEIQFLDITEDCLILLCSDGLSDNDFIEENWSQHLEPLISSQANLQDGLFKLVDLANEHNGHDNITAVLLRIKLKPDF